MPSATAAAASGSESADSLLLRAAATNPVAASVITEGLPPPARSVRPRTVKNRAAVSR